MVVKNLIAYVMNIDEVNKIYEEDIHKIETPSNQLSISFIHSEWAKNGMEVQQQEKILPHVDRPFDGLDKIVTLYNGKTMPLTQYRLNTSIESQPRQQQAEVTSIQSSQMIQPKTKIMTVLIVNPNGVQTLVKFSAPVEAVVSVTSVKSLLNRIGVPGTGKSIKIKCLACPTSSYNYLAEIENIQQQEPEPELPESTKRRTGFLAVCPNCGVCSDDHFRCVRCRAVFDENVLYIPSAN